MTSLLAGQLLMFVGIAALFPIAPLYVRARGGGSAMVAAFVAGPLVANMLAQVPAGRLADRIGRRPLLLGSRLAYSVLAFALFLDRGPLWLLAVLRAGQGLAAGAYVPALLAALTDLTEPARRAERFAQLQASELVGLLVGPLVGGAVALWKDNGVFLVSGAGVLAGVLVQSTVPETHSVADRRSAPPPAGWWRDRGILVGALGLAALGAVFSMYDVVWPQFLAARDASTLVIGISISLFALPMIVLAGPGGRLSDRSDRRLVLGLSFAATAAACSSYPFLRSIPVIVVIGCVEACFIVMCEPSLYASIGDAAPAEARGRAMGVGGLVRFAGSALGAAVLGSLYGIREGVPFWSGGCVLVGAAILCGALIPPGPRAGRRPSAAAREPEAGRLVVDGVEDGDDAERTHVHRTFLPGELDELGRPLPVEHGDGFGHVGVDADVAAVREAQDGHGVADLQ
ncbi:MAG TPA: MFS transporter [Candidatus Dormibacteraeota bacterium]|nr:MFS transporter [Candidatus Dormibacteraeota bacterium]